MKTWLTAFALLCTCVTAMAQQTLWVSTSQPLSNTQYHYMQAQVSEMTYMEGHAVQLDMNAVDNREIMINLPDGRSVVFDKMGGKDHLGNGKYWWGEARGNNSWSINLFRKDEHMTVLIDMGKDMFRIESLGEGLHWFSSHNPSSYPHDESEHDYAKMEMDFTDRIEPENRGDQGSYAGVEEIAGVCSLRLYILYTDDIAASFAEPTGRIINANGRFNQSNDQSLVDWNVEIAAIEQVVYTDNSSLESSDVISDIEGTSDGVLDWIHSKRDLYDADVVQMLTLNGGCGLASGIGSNFNTAFCQSKWSCIDGNLTYAHEVGHLVGCKHDPYVLTLPIGNAHGFVSFPNRWRTVMAYGDECNDLGDACTRVRHWSNPNTDTAGVAFGTPNTSDPFDATHFNVETLDDDGPDVAAFQGQIINKTIFEDDVVTDDETADIIAALTLTSSNNYTINSGGSATFRAPLSIQLNPGFKANSGSTFRAFIDDCSGIPRMAAEQNTPEEEVITLSTSLSPNPADRITMVQVNPSQHGLHTISVLDQNGRLMYQKGFQFERGIQTTVEIPVAKYSAGLYTVSIQSETDAVQQKLVVAH